MVICLMAALHFRKMAQYFEQFNRTPFAKCIYHTKLIINLIDGFHQFFFRFTSLPIDIYSSHTSSSFSPSPSEGAETPNSLIHDAENNRLTANIEENGNERAMKKSKLNENCLKSDKPTLVDGVQQNGEGTYHCQFCEKSFPRLGYLKKHEQVSVIAFMYFSISIYNFYTNHDVSRELCSF